MIGTRMPGAVDGSTRTGSRARSGPARDEPARPLDGSATLAPPWATEVGFTIADLGRLRRAVAEAAATAGLDEVRAADLALAVDELATNSICHGGGEGVMRLWRDEDALVCEVQDRGYIAEPWIRHVRPGADLLSGRGLWLVEQVCDLVQIKSSPRTGSMVRIKMLLASPAPAFGD